MRPIDADKITTKEICYYLGQAFASCEEEMRDMINNQPTVDAVPVVRCKDCTFAEKVDDREPKYKCTNICSDGRIQWLSSEDFCSYGECKESVDK